MRTKRRVRVQVVPSSGGGHAISNCAVFLMLFADAPSVVYLESQQSDDPTLVARYQESYDLLRAAALPPEASLAVVESAAEEFRDGLWRGSPVAHVVVQQRHRR